MTLPKRLLRTLIFWFGPLVVAAVGLWLYLQGGSIVSTDNAYLKAEQVSINSELSGKVVEVAVTDNQRVDAGQLLFRIDDQAYRIALARAEANLLKVHSNIESLRADFLNKQADINKAQSDFDYYQKESERLQKLKAKDAVTAKQIDLAAHEAMNAEQEVAITRQALAVVKAKLVSPTLSVESHPDYQLALVEREKAALDLSHVDVKAAKSGVLANFGVKAGEVINASVPLGSIVDDSKFWIEANFKETDLTYLRIGQHATIRVDAYPDLVWQGKVQIMTPGTGSEFSLLPAQNSTGNWVKVVQRLNVKLEMETLSNQPALAAGMSAFVEVTTGHKRELPWR
jgi:membrane fusion protein, multidrug efflux system